MHGSSADRQPLEADVTWEFSYGVDRARCADKGVRPPMPQLDEALIAYWGEREGEASKESEVDAVKPVELAFGDAQIASAG